MGSFLRWCSCSCSPVAQHTPPVSSFVPGVTHIATHIVTLTKWYYAIFKITMYNLCSFLSTLMFVLLNIWDKHTYTHTLTHTHTHTHTHKAKGCRGGWAGVYSIRDTVCLFVSLAQEAKRYCNTSIYKALTVTHLSQCLLFHTQLVFFISIVIWS